MDSEYKLSKLLSNTGDMALKRRAKRIIEALNIKEGDNILEVGCGDGFYLHLISNLGIKKLNLTGLDIDRGALISAKRNLKGKKVKLVYGDVMKKLPFKNNYFDSVIMSEVCEHLSDDVKGLQEVKRVLKIRGTLVATVPNHNYPFLWDPINWTLERLFDKHIKSGFFAGLWNQHLRLYSKKEIEQSIKKAGFTIEKSQNITWWCLPFNHYIINLTARAIHSGKLSQDTKAAINKYEVKVRRPLLLNIAFSITNIVDKLNDILPVNNSGVGVFVVAIKNKYLMRYNS